MIETTPVQLSRELIFPTKINFHKETLTERYGRFVAEPLERGWGDTVGNSLRRILLSSLEGVAVTAVKVAGAKHEFAALKGVQEDVLHIILNLKRLRLKLFSDGPEILYLQADKAGEVKASAIRETPNAEVINRDLVIATLEPGAKLDIELEVSRGRGYLPSELNKREGRPAGFLVVDALFSPIVKINYDVENARVGHITDYDRLNLDIWTDGSLSPSDALSKALTILSSLTGTLLTAVSGNGAAKAGRAGSIEEAGELHDITEEIGKTKTSDYAHALRDPKVQELLVQPIETLELAPRTLNCLKVAHIKTIRDLVKKGEEELLAYKNFGEKSLTEVKEKIKELGLDLGLKI
ncbi:MAG: DNA-directed RNA polymerase subunit alpha [Elusimicrobia bacterium]|nr:DNA-directed RNA polymerase subunit alpha [Elusimicrobiota bacterium]